MTDEKKPIQEETQVNIKQEAEKVEEAFKQETEQKEEDSKQEETLKEEDSKETETKEEEAPIEEKKEKEEKEVTLKEKLFGNKDKQKKLDELQKKYDELQKNCDELSKNYDELSDRNLRMMAEYQNYRRRSEKEKADIYSTANSELLKQLLAVNDNFERALQTKTEDEAYRAGIEGIYKQLQGLFEKNDVKEIESLGKAFDPNFHNAVMSVEATEEIKSGCVATVLQKGYQMGNKVLRPAMVAVAQ